MCMYMCLIWWLKLLLKLKVEGSFALDRSRGEFGLKSNSL